MTMGLKLMNAFFTKNELAAGCCTDVDGRELLRLNIIDGIQIRLLSSFGSEAVSCFSIKLMYFH